MKVQIPKVNIPNIESQINSKANSFKIPNFDTTVPEFDTTIQEFDTSGIISEMDSFADAKINVPDVSSMSSDFNLKDFNIQSMIPKDLNVGQTIKAPNITGMFNKQSKSSFGSGLGEKIKKIFPNMSQIIDKTGIKDVFSDLELPSTDDLKIDKKSFEFPEFNIDEKIQIPKSFDIDVNDIFKKIKN